ncbi:MAG: hypothetical protein IOD12_08270 [Silvanigrellales bacterium]|nr:hypothetical protein [Silvanigrellales bacterium]
MEQAFSPDTSFAKTRSAGALGTFRRLTLFGMVLGILATGGCRKRSFHAVASSPKNAESNASVVAQSFCARSAAESADDPDGYAARRDQPGHIWTAREIQFHINALLKSPEFKGKAASAYLVAYRSMLQGRDAERCRSGSPMREAGAPEDKVLNEALNDALADVMTRSLLNISRFCVSTMADPAAMPPKSFESGAELFVVDVGGLWCSLFRDAHAEKADSITFAMASTALYLTINLGFGLSALPHIDAAWPQDAYKTLPERVQRLERFKPTYDAFNAFLAKNTDTVSGALNEAGLVKNKGAFSFATDFVELLPFASQPFQAVRDSAFRLGLEIAANTPFHEHPLAEMVPSGDSAPERTVVRTQIVSVIGRQLSVEERKPLREPLEKLVALGRHIAKVFSRKTFKIFGGVRFGDEV